MSSLTTIRDILRSKGQSHPSDLTAECVIALADHIDRLQIELTSLKTVLGIIFTEAARGIKIGDETFEAFEQAHEEESKRR